MANFTIADIKTLREQLGTHVAQKGSLVAPERLRFDFSHFAQVADEELQDVEDIVNREVLGNVKRNRILRALVRFSLNNREDLEQAGKVERVEPPSATGGAGQAPEPPSGK